MENIYFINGNIESTGVNSTILSYIGNELNFLITPDTGFNILYVHLNGQEINTTGGVYNNGDYDKTVPQTFNISGIQDNDVISYEFEVTPKTRIFNALLADNAVKNRIRASNANYKVSTLRKVTNLKQVRYTYEISDTGATNRVVVSVHQNPVFYEGGNSGGTMQFIGFVNTFAYYNGSGSKTFYVSNYSGINQSSPAAVSAECEINFSDNGGVYDVEVKHNGIIIESFTSAVSVSTPLHILVQAWSEDSNYVEARDIGLIGNFQ